jgi:predicted ATPase/class 3 adenylate cyclase
MRAGELPSERVTFFLTDIEGSTRLWELDPNSMSLAIARHDALAGDAIERNGGLLLKARGEGDSVFAVFERAIDALIAALALQQALKTEPWPEQTPVRVRIALHTGDAEVRAGDYFGATVNRAARLRAIAHGGQTILSQACEELVRDLLPDRVSLHDLGEHRLKDLARAEHVFQLSHPDLVEGFPPLRSLNPRLTNLPIQLTSFVGRERESAEIARLLRSTRLVTLTGAGGVGKTRLGLQFGASSIDRFPDGVLLVELAALSDPELLVHAVASAFGLSEHPDRSLVDVVVSFLRDRHLLLILDNCEHLIDACAHLVDNLLRTCADLRIIATSQEPLAVPGEATFRIPSLPAPVPGAASLEEVRPHDAVRLFVDRAALALPGFALRTDNAKAIGQICSSLDGIPLAIELAASRIRTLTPEQVSDGLNDRLRLLTGGARTVAHRHQTLRAAIEWSHELLTQPERVLFARLTVFAGGFTPAAVESVCAGGPIAATTDVLSRLVERSLVVAEDEEASRFSMLETIRQYAAEQLATSGATDEFRRRHAEWFLSLLEEMEPGLTGREQKMLLERLDTEHDNARQALAWAIGGDHDADLGLKLAGSMSVYWEVRAYQTEGQRWLEQALALTAGTRTPARVKACVNAGVLTERDPAASRRFLEEALAIARELGEPRMVALAVHSLARLEAVMSNSDRAIALLEESLEIARDLVDRKSMWESLHTLSGIALDRGKYLEAQALTEEALACAREVGDTRRLARSKSSLGAIAYAEGAFELAFSLHSETLLISRELGDRWREAVALESLGHVIYARGEIDGARDLWTQALTIHREAEDTFGTSRALAFLGRVALDGSDVRGARVLLEESLVIGRKLGDRAQTVDLLGEWAALVAAEGHPERAGRLLGAAEATRESIAYIRPVAEQMIWERRLSAVQAVIGEEEFRTAFGTGRAMSHDEAIEYAVAE